MHARMLQLESLSTTRRRDGSQLSAKARKGAVRLAVLLIAGLLGCEAEKPSRSPTQREQQKPQRAAPPAANAAMAAENADDMPESMAPEILPETHMAAGRLHESQGHLPRAIDQYRQVIALNPRHIEARNRMAVALDQLGRFNEADETFQQAIKIAPNQIYLRNNLAFSYVMQGRWKEAEAALNEALQRRPDFTRARVNLAMVTAQQGRFDEALTQFERALPKGDAYYNLGLMYQSKRRLPEAARAFKAALEHNPRLTAAQKRIDKLPPEAVKAAGTTSIATASPVAAATEQISPEQTVRPGQQMPDLSSEAAADQAASADQPLQSEIDAMPQVAVPEGHDGGEAQASAETSTTALPCPPAAVREVLEDRSAEEVATVPDQPVNSGPVAQAAEATEDTQNQAHPTNETSTDGSAALDAEPGAATEGVAEAGTTPEAKVEGEDTSDTNHEAAPQDAVNPDADSHAAAAGSDSQIQTDMSTESSSHVNEVAEAGLEGPAIPEAKTDATTDSSNVPETSAGPAVADQKDDASHSDTEENTALNSLALAPAELALQGEKIEGTAPESTVVADDENVTLPHETPASVLTDPEFAWAVSTSDSPAPAKAEEPVVEVAEAAPSTSPAP